jgi:hypothetical protein
MCPFPSLPSLRIDNRPIVDWSRQRLTTFEEKRLTLQEELSSLVDDIDQPIGHESNERLGLFNSKCV